MPSRRQFLSHAAGLGAGLLPASGQARRPNVVFILTDDQGWGDLRAHGNDRLDTPALDGLRNSSVSFDRFYVSPVCSPTRASILTGRHPLRSNVLSTSRGYEMMNPAEVTLAETLRQAGYATGCFGKWHNGFYYPSTARGQGFDEFFGFNGGFLSNYFDPELIHNDRKVKTRGFMSDVLTDEAIRFIENNRSRPFFCYIPYNHPHSPMQAPDGLFDKYTRRGFDPMAAAAYAMVERVDTNVGRVLARLDSLGLASDTIVIFASDNGPMGSRHAFNCGLRGDKGSVHEGGVRVPLFVRWPGRLAAGATVRQIAAHIDLFPTIMELTGTPAPRALPLDGVSLAPLLHGKTAGWPDRMLFTIPASRPPDGKEVPRFPAAVRTQRYLWVQEGKEEMLFDIPADPGETANLAGKLPAVTARLREAYLNWLRGVHSGPYRRLPIQVGHRESNPVELHAQHCSFRGGTKYFGRGWEYDWAVGFRTPDDYIFWDLDVVRQGRYEAVVQYACPAQDVGTRVSVEVGAAMGQGSIAAPHDPAPIPRPDRVPRWEVNDKPFAALNLGRLDLNKGRAQLVLRAVAVTGESKLEIEGVHLKLLG